MADPYRNPLPTVDIIIQVSAGIVLIERKNPPFGWAIPGGFVDYGESVEACARRESKEETGLDVRLTDLLYVYSRPDRDPRHHTLTTVFLAEADGHPVAADDAISAGVFDSRKLPDPLAFDHAIILSDYFQYRQGVDRKRILQPHLIRP